MFFRKRAKTVEFYLFSQPIGLIEDRIKHFEQKNPCFRVVSVQKIAEKPLFEGEKEVYVLLWYRFSVRKSIVFWLKSVKFPTNIIKFR
jgi:hypothetical protein